MPLLRTTAAQASIPLRAGMLQVGKGSRVDAALQAQAAGVECSLPVDLPIP